MIHHMAGSSLQPSTVCTEAPESIVPSRRRCSTIRWIFLSVLECVEWVSQMFPLGNAGLSQPGVMKLPGITPLILSHSRLCF